MASVSGAEEAAVDDIYKAGGSGAEAADDIRLDLVQRRQPMIFSRLDLEQMNGPWRRIIGSRWRRP